MQSRPSCRRWSWWDGTRQARHPTPPISLSSTKYAQRSHAAWARDTSAAIALQISEVNESGVFLLLDLTPGDKGLELPRVYEPITEACYAATAPS